MMEAMRGESVLPPSYLRVGSSMSCKHQTQKHYQGEELNER